MSPLTNCSAGKCIVHCRLQEAIARFHSFECRSPSGHQSNHFNPIDLGLHSIANKTSFSRKRQNTRSAGLSWHRISQIDSSTGCNRPKTETRALNGVMQTTKRLPATIFWRVAVNLARRLPSSLSSHSPKTRSFTSCDNRTVRRDGSPWKGGSLKSSPLATNFCHSVRIDI